MHADSRKLTCVREPKDKVPKRIVIFAVLHKVKARETQHCRDEDKQDDKTMLCKP
jgi:hypothetical protein